MFLLRAWNSDLDEEIIRILENEGKTYFYHLWKELGVSKRTLNDHIKRMEDQEIIEKDGHPQIGKKRFTDFILMQYLKSPWTSLTREKNREHLMRLMKKGTQ